LTISITAGTSSDDAGNVDAGAGPSEVVIVDNAGPVAGIITVEAGSAFTIPVSWTEAVDTVDASADLVYSLYMTDAPYTLASVTDPADIAIVEGQMLIDSGTALLSSLATDLVPLSDYYFNVIVEDTQGNKTIYSLAGVLGQTRSFDRTDTDGDGIPDDVELNIGTDPFDPNDTYGGGNGAGDDDGDCIPNGLEDYLNVLTGNPDIDTTTDSDGDCIPDYLEVMNGTNPIDGDDPVVNGANDTDGDGICDAMEFILGTDPASAIEIDLDNNGVPDAIEQYLDEMYALVDITAITDTDGDGLADLIEAIIGSPPLNPNCPILNGFADSDGDGVTDAVEYYLEVVLGLPEVDLASDGDGDGLPDVLELAIGTQPDNIDDPVVNGGGDDDGDGITNALEWYTSGVVENSTLTFTVTQLKANGKDSTELTVLVQNAAGQPIIGATVTIELLGISDATVSDIVDNGDGTYTATITAGVESGTMTVEVTVFDGLITFTLPGADIKILKVKPPRTGGGDASILLLLLLFVWLLARNRGVRSGAMSLTALCFVVAMGSSQPVKALDLSTAWYVGGGIGASSVDPDTSGTIYATSDDNDVAWQIFGGYRFNEKFSVELAYADLGKADLQIAGGRLAGTPAGEVSFKQATLGIVWSPVMASNQTWRPFLKGGLNYNDHEWNAGVLESEDFSAFAGIGIEKFFGKEDLSLRAEYSYYTEESSALFINLVKYFPY
jgi:hypothetical protein